MLTLYFNNNQISFLADQPDGELLLLHIFVSRREQHDLSLGRTLSRIIEDNN